VPGPAHRPQTLDEWLSGVTPADPAPVQRPRTLQDAATSRPRTLEDAPVVPTSSGAPAHNPLETANTPSIHRPHSLGDLPAASGHRPQTLGDLSAMPVSPAGQAPRPRTLDEVPAIPPAAVSEKPPAVWEKPLAVWEEPAALAVEPAAPPAPEGTAASQTAAYTDAWTGPDSGQQTADPDRDEPEYLRGRRPETLDDRLRGTVRPSTLADHLPEHGHAARRPANGGPSWAGGSGEHPYDRQVRRPASLADHPGPARTGQEPVPDEPDPDPAH
jgi:hypothetical protein